MSADFLSDGLAGDAGAAPGPTGRLTVTPDAETAAASAEIGGPGRWLRRSSPATCPTAAR